MSLVGNLEDLSLGDIMQIISLSQKFGVLSLQGERGSGRIVFASGMVRGACLKGVEGHFSDLRSLIVGKGILDPAGFDACESRASDLGLSVEEMLRSEASLDVERLNELVKEAVEAAVLEMFTWPSGDFSFDVRSEPDAADPQLILRNGINSQYLAMEGMRVRDEKGREDSPGEPADDSAEPASLDELSAQEMFGVDQDDDPEDFDETVLEVDEDDGLDDPLVVVPEIETIELLEECEEAHEATAIQAESAAAFVDDNETTATNVVVEAVLAKDSDEGVDAEAVRVHPRPLILIDPDVAVLEWVKHALQKQFRQVHVFQQAEQGLMRIRQYLIRGELPVVLISPDAEVDPLSGIRGLGDFVKRLKAQAAKLPIFGLVEGAEQPVPVVGSHFDGMLARPARPQLRASSSDERVDPAARSFASALDTFLSA
jgi:hypothetical protein